MIQIMKIVNKGWVTEYTSAGFFTAEEIDSAFEMLQGVAPEGVSYKILK